MKEFVNPLNFESSLDAYKASKKHGVNIVDFETVCYDKSDFERGRSLSLNFYRYRKSLEPFHILDANKTIDKAEEVRYKQTKEKNFDLNLEQNGIVQTGKVNDSFNRHSSRATICFPVGWSIITWVLIVSFFIVNMEKIDKINGICLNPYSLL